MTEAAHVIPAITDPLGSSWDQPTLGLIEIEGDFAIMSRAAFDKLAEYSSTRPTGVYAGKMWKRHDGVFDREYLRGGGKPEWMLCWYGNCEKPECPGCTKFCSNHHRKILIRRGDGARVDVVTDSTLTVMRGGAVDLMNLTVLKDGELKTLLD